MILPKNNISWTTTQQAYSFSFPRMPNVGSNVVPCYKNRYLWSATYGRNCTFDSLASCGCRAPKKRALPGPKTSRLARTTPMLKYTVCIELFFILSKDSISLSQYWNPTEENETYMTFMVGYWNQISSINGLIFFIIYVNDYKENHWGNNMSRWY